MKLLCILSHRWNYGEEKVPVGKQYSGSHITIQKRICKRCHQKQRLLDGTLWCDVALTKEELREIKLKELGL